MKSLRLQAGSGGTTQGSYIGPPGGQLDLLSNDLVSA